MCWIVSFALLCSLIFLEKIGIFGDCLVFKRTLEGGEDKISGY